MTYVESATHADALVARLQGHGFAVGDHVAPRSADGGTIVTPAAIVYLRAGTPLEGSIAGPQAVTADGIFRFQVTAVGKTAAQARWVGDRVAEELEGFPLEVDGRYLPAVRRDNFLDRIDRDEDVNPPLFYMPVIFRAMSNAADGAGS